MTTTEAAVRLILIAVVVTGVAICLGWLIGNVRDLLRRARDLID